MSTVIGALAPIFLLIALGWASHRSGFLTASFWAPAEKLTYYILFPALLLSNLAQADLHGLPVPPIVGALAVTTLAAAAAAFVWAPAASRRPFRLSPPAFSSVFQGMIRPNTYVGFAVAAGLFGAGGVTLTALCIALVVPLVNLLSVLALLRWGQSANAGRRGGNALLAIVKNPLILSCLAGIALNVGGLGLPPVIGPVLKILAQASLALGLLAVGAGLTLSGLRRAGAATVLCTGVKLVALPAATALLAWALGLRDLPLAAIVLYAGLPVAPASYVLARQMGGDGELMAALITTSTIAAAVTMPVLALTIARLP